MKNPDPQDLPAALIERVAKCIPGSHRSKEQDLAGIELILDLEGYDTSDAAWVKAVRKRAAWVIRDERASFGALAALLEMKITNESVGRAIGMPKSTVQATGAGRVPERLTEDQRARMHTLLDALARQIDVVRESLGN